MNDEHASVIIYFNNEHASVIMVAIKPCGTQIYLFLYIKSHHCYKVLSDNWYGAGSRVQVSMKKVWEECSA